MDLDDILRWQAQARPDQIERVACAAQHAAIFARYDGHTPAQAHAAGCAAGELQIIVEGGLALLRGPLRLAGA